MENSAISGVCTLPQGSLSSQVGGPAWGSTEGGRDKLGWVRDLITFTEEHPIALPGREGIIQFTGMSVWSYFTLLK